MAQDTKASHEVLLHALNHLKYVKYHAGTVKRTAEAHKQTTTGDTRSKWLATALELSVVTRGVEDAITRIERATAYISSMD